jgi:beta-lactamase class A
MAFYRPDGEMVATLEHALGTLEKDGRPGLRAELSLTWLRYEGSLIGLGEADPAAFWEQGVLGASWNGDRLHYPASVVKLFYMAAVEAWLQRRLLSDGSELRRAMADMIRDSGNDATSLLVDLLSGTTSGPELPEGRMRAWIAQRQLVNGWLRSLGWHEIVDCNVCQKTWGEGPYGRERQFYGPDLENRNRLSAEATARLLHAVIAGAFLSPPACARMRDLLQRSLDPSSRAADPENQVDGFLGEGLPAGSRLWSKAGWMSQARHDAAYVEIDGHHPFLVVAFGESRARAADTRLLPELARVLAEACRQD